MAHQDTAAHGSAPKEMLSTVVTKGTHNSAGDQSVQVGDLMDLGIAAVAAPKRDFTQLDILSLGYNICSSWLGLATSFALAIAAGGTTTLLYGVILVTMMITSTALTLAELTSVYPTAGGQYHFASILAPERFSRGFSYVCGTLAAFSWVAIIASVTFITSQIVLSIVLQYDDSYVEQPWHLFLVYLALAGAVALYNLYALRFTQKIYDIGREYEVELQDWMRTLTASQCL